MKRFTACFLALVLLFSFCFAAVPVRAASGTESAMRAYAEIVANAGSYDFGVDSYVQIDDSHYQYALVDVTDGGGIPTLLLKLSIQSVMHGYMDYIRVFQYDLKSGTVRAPSGIISAGAASVGGFRGGIGQLRGHLISTEFQAMTGQGNFYQVGFAGNELTYTAIWSGMVDQIPDSYRLDGIDWKDLSDMAVFTPYLYTGPLASVAYCGDRDACSMSAEAALAFADTIRDTGKAVVRAALFDAGGGTPLLWVAWGDDSYIDENGRTVLTGDYGDQVYGFGGGRIIRCPWMTTLLRAGENGVIVQKKGSYYSDFAEDFSMYRLTGGGIMAAPFATGTHDPFNGSTLNGQKVNYVFDLTSLYEKAEPGVQILLSAESGLADMLFLSGVWSDGAAMRDALLAYAEAKAPAAPEKLAYASAQTVNVDGRDIEFQCYALKDEKGNPTNYIKLRDLAILLNGSAAQFDVGWDGSVNILPHTAYTPNGSELRTPFSGDRAYRDSDAVTKIGGQAVPLSAFMLTDNAGGGYTYYKLRDLGEAIGFNVGWSADRGIFVETDKPYDPAN